MSSSFSCDTMQLKIRERLENYRRVLIVARKPDKEDYVLTARVCALGVIVVGIMGFALYLIAALIIG